MKIKLREPLTEIEVDEEQLELLTNDLCWDDLFGVDQTKKTYKDLVKRWGAELIVSVVQTLLGEAVKAKDCRIVVECFNENPDKKEELRFSMHDGMFISFTSEHFSVDIDDNEQ